MISVPPFTFFRLPDLWHPLFTFGKPLRYCDIFHGSSDCSEIFLAATVMPMGWLSAVGILQHAHRRLATLTSPTGLPLQAEIRRDAPLPQVSLQAFQEFWHLYLDDSTFLEWVSQESDCKNSPAWRPSHFQEILHRVYRTWNIPWSEQKSIMREGRATRLGVELDGEEGLLGVHVEKRLELFQLAMHLLGSETISRKAMQIFLGKMVHLMQFRRPAFSFVHALWRRVLGPPISGPFLPYERREIFMVLGGLLLLDTNLRAKVSGIVTASDASETGGGVCKGHKVSEIGRMEMTVQVLAANHIPPTLSDCNGVLVFEWSAGIGSLRQALDLLHIPITKCVICEPDDIQAMVYRKRWGIDMRLQDLRHINESQVCQRINELPHISMVIQGGQLPDIAHPLH